MADEKVDRAYSKAEQALAMGQGLDRNLLEHQTRVQGYWDEHWRWKDEMNGRQVRIEDRVDRLESWRDNLRGQLAVWGFLGAVAGGLFVSLLNRALTG